MRAHRTALLVAAVATAVSGAGLVGYAAADDSPTGASLPAGGDFVTALAARDFVAAEKQLAEGIEFRGITPSMGQVQRHGRGAVMDLMREWYGTAQGLDRLETDKILTRDFVSYRVRWTAPEGLMAFEQHAFYNLDDQGRISRMDLVCSGDHAVKS